jgi:hypothetical protein
MNPVDDYLAQLRLVIPSFKRHASRCDSAANRPSERAAAAAAAAAVDRQTDRRTGTYHATGCKI